MRQAGGQVSFSDRFVQLKLSSGFAEERIGKFPKGKKRMED
jgi:hypothetical protein